jgi:hypothetical protein
VTNNTLGKICTKIILLIEENNKEHYEILQQKDYGANWWDAD